MTDHFDAGSFATGVFAVTLVIVVFRFTYMLGKMSND